MGKQYKEYVPPRTLKYRCENKKKETTVREVKEGGRGGVGKGR